MCSFHVDLPFCHSFFKYWDSLFELLSGVSCTPNVQQASVTSNHRIRLNCPCESQTWGLLWCVELANSSICLWTSIRYQKHFYGMSALPIVLNKPSQLVTDCCMCVAVCSTVGCLEMQKLLSLTNAKPLMDFLYALLHNSPLPKTIFFHDFEMWSHCHPDGWPCSVALSNTSNWLGPCCLTGKLLGVSMHHACVMLHPLNSI